MKSYGFISGNHSFGFAEDLLVSSSPLQIPFMGTGPLGDGKILGFLSPVFSNLQVYMLSPLSVNLTVDVKNLTQSISLGSFTISSGTLTANQTVGSPFSPSSNDLVVIELSVASGQVFIPGFQWMGN